MTKSKKVKNTLPDTCYSCDLIYSGNLETSLGPEVI